MTPTLPYPKAKSCEMCSRWTPPAEEETVGRCYYVYELLDMGSQIESAGVEYLQTPAGFGCTYHDPAPQTPPPRIYS